MARVETSVLPPIHGKLNKKSDDVYRVRNGRQFVHTETKSTVPASRAQKLNRKHFGKVTALVNVIMADSAQVEDWTQKMKEFNTQATLNKSPFRYKTVRKFIHAAISEQIAAKEARSRRRLKPIQMALPKGYRLTVKHFSELTTTELYEILKARFTYFCLGQNCQDLDMDNADYHAIHIAIRHRAKVIAYARLCPNKKRNEWVLGKMLMLEDGEAYRQYILEQAKGYVQEQGGEMKE